MKKLGIIFLFIFSVFGSISFAQSATERKKSTFEVDIGYSRYFVDPDVDLKLDGITGEIKGYFGKENLDFISKGLLQFHEVTFACSKVLQGNIDAYAFGLSYGRRYDFPRIYLGYGFGPYSYWLLSNKKTDSRSGFSLDTGLRVHVYFLMGIKYAIIDHFILTLNIKYNFTVKKVRLHNPFVPHKHADIFHYFTFNVGLMK